MDDPSVGAWRAGAAYLYVLHLDGPGLAWEYLRRHPDYRRLWRCRHQRPRAARDWGLRGFEDPSLDARDAHPDWLAVQAAVLHLYPDEDPPEQASIFELWDIPGRKSLTHNGKHLLLTSQWPGGHAQIALAPGLENGMAFLLAARASGQSQASCRALVAQLAKLVWMAWGQAAVRARPSAAALLELHALQALDATLVGASQRQIAIGLFGPQAVAADWHADGALRSRIRRLVRHGRLLMCGGYRRLANLG